MELCVGDGGHFGGGGDELLAGIGGGFLLGGVGRVAGGWFGMMQISYVMG